MSLPPLVSLGGEAEYRMHFETVYCVSSILTFDGIPVFFRKADFDHFCFESSNRDRVKDRFSQIRGERLDWIKATLENPKADLYQGWDRERRVALPNRRVAVVYEDFVVVINIKLLADGTSRGSFVTAYQADNSIVKIRAMPRWVKK